MQNTQRDGSISSIIIVMAITAVLLIAIGVPNYVSYSVFSKQETAKETLELIRTRMECLRSSLCMTLEEATGIVIAAERNSGKTRYYEDQLYEGGLFLIGNIDADITNDVWWLSPNGRIVHKINDMGN